MLKREGEEYIGGTVLCATEEAKGAGFMFRVLLTGVVVLLALPAMMLNIWNYSRKIQHFPIKGRAPRLLRIQLINFLILSIAPLVAEVLILSGVKWEDPLETYISRSLVKGIYLLARTSIYLIYILRTLLIYANWKVPMDHLDSRFWRVFGREGNSILVEKTVID